MSGSSTSAWVFQRLSKSARPRGGSRWRCPLPVQGHAVVLDAVRRLVSAGIDLECHLIGEGPLRESIEADVDRMGLRAIVQFTGKSPHPELMKRYEDGEYAVVVLSSVTLADGTREGIPISLVEAMARGIPTIGSSCGGIPELLADGAGTLVPEGDANALADAIEHFLADPQSRHAVGAAGRERIVADFEVRTQTQRLLEAAQIQVDHRGAA